MSFRPVMGLDLSLRSTGICVATAPGVLMFERAGGALTREQAKRPDMELSRWNDIVSRVLRLAQIGNVKHAATEAPAYGGHPNDALAELRGAVKWAVRMSPHSPIVDLRWVHTGTARKFVLRNGAMKKPEVTANVRAALGRPTLQHDECDAAVVAEWLSWEVNGRGILATGGRPWA